MLSTLLNIYRFGCTQISLPTVVLHYTLKMSDIKILIYLMSEAVPEAVDLEKKINDKRIKLRPTGILTDKRNRNNRYQ